MTASPVKAEPNLAELAIIRKLMVAHINTLSYGKSFLWTNDPNLRNGIENIIAVRVKNGEVHRNEDNITQPGRNFIEVEAELSLASIIGLFAISMEQDEFATLRRQESIHLANLQKLAIEKMNDAELDLAMALYLMGPRQQTPLYQAARLENNKVKVMDNGSWRLFSAHTNKADLVQVLTNAELSSSAQVVSYTEDRKVTKFTYAAWAGPIRFEGETLAIAVGRTIAALLREG